MTRILYVNDVHFYGTFKPHYSKAAIALPKFFSFLESVKDDFDLLIIGGDLVNNGPFRIKELEQFNHILLKTEIPFQVVAGNHDMSVNNEEYCRMYPETELLEDCSMEDTNFGRIFGKKGIRNTYITQGMKLIFFSLRNKDPDGQLQWLEEELSDRTPALLFCHYPLTTSRTGGFAESWGYNRIKDIRQPLADLIRKNDTQILAYFCGHQHLNSRMLIGRTEQIVTGSLGLATCCYRILEITRNTVEVSTHKLPGIPDWLDDAMNVDNSVDAEHDTVEKYHWGNKDERNFSIKRIIDGTGI